MSHHILIAKVEITKVIENKRLDLLHSGIVIGTTSMVIKFAKIDNSNLVLVINLGKTSIIQNAWAERNGPYLHGWVYDIGSGFIKTQTSMINNEETLKEVCKFEMGIIGN